MFTKKRLTVISLLFPMALPLTLLTFLGCEPKSPAQKMEDTVEDAGHEMKQGAERMGEKIEDAAEESADTVEDATQ